GTLDAAKAEGAIVVCTRGGGARVDKSAAVAAAGGAGMVLVNTRRQSTDADVHAVPTVHLDVAEARTLLGYLGSARGRATASLDPSGRTAERVPAIAGFSARGPVRGADVLKPDLTAPGVSVLGAVAPPSDSGRTFDLLSGTSTSAPHVAGLAAFIRSVHRDWSAARVKSAMMTTAYDLSGSHSPLREGAGHVAPSRFLDPGLVFDALPGQWRRVAGGQLRMRDANTPSIGLAQLVGHATVTRRITNVSGRTESYAVRKLGLRDVDVQAFPATVRLGAGETRTIRLRITARPTATVDRDVSGWLVWAGDRHRVRIPVAVRPTVVSAPEHVDGRGDRGSVVVSGRSGNGRTVMLHTSGLVPARTSDVALAAGPFDVQKPTADDDTRVDQVDVPARTEVARFEVASTTPGDDVDLYVYRDGRLVGSSTEDVGTATVTLTDPATGDYDVYTHAHTVTGESTTGTLSTWVVPRDGGPQVSLSTDAVGESAGRRFRYSASWDDLDPSKRWLGVVTYGDTDRHTLVEVN
ncbi:MAG: S8 family serine peptidase, partial [Nocardioidaceae bacterium]|nr:S8 family serine peptidase [Nocardioidaceae bacterium]